MEDVKLLWGYMENFLLIIWKKKKKRRNKIVGVLVKFAWMCGSERADQQEKLYSFFIDSKYWCSAMEFQKEFYKSES